MSSLMGTLEADVELSASPKKFHAAFNNAPSQLISICPDVVQACDLLDGEWGNQGSITQWSYVHDGDTKSAKMIIESADAINNSMTYGLIEGDLKNDFSNFTVKIEATQKDEGCNVHLTVGYIKLNEDVPAPQSVLDLGVQVFKILGAHLAQA